MDKKRLIFIIVFIAASIGLGYLMYRVFFKAETSTTTPTGTETQGPTGQLPTTGTFTQSPTVGQTGTSPTGAVDTTGRVVTTGDLPTSQIRQVIQNVSANLIDPKISSGGKITYYNTIDGKFYTSVAGQEQELSDQVFFNVEKVTWSPNQNEGILEYPDGSNIYYNFDTNKQTTLPKHWEDFSFSDQGDEIVAKSLGLSSENKWLVTSNADGTEINLIEPLGENADKVIVDWSPNKQIVGISLTGEAVGADRQEVLFIGKNGENFKSIIVEGRGFESEWSPTGNKLLYSVYSTRSEYKPELWIVDTNPTNIGANRKMLGINTWSDKCTFADDRIIYCAVPESLPIGSGFSQELASSAVYRILKIDTQTGSQNIIPIDTAYNIDQVFLSPDKTSLYFTDKFSSGLFSVEL